MPAELGNRLAAVLQRTTSRYVGGGGTQYIIPDARYLYFTGHLKLTSFGTKIKTW